MEILRELDAARVRCNEVQQKLDDETESRTVLEADNARQAERLLAMEKRVQGLEGELEVARASTSETASAAGQREADLRKQLAASHQQVL